MTRVRRRAVASVAALASVATAVAVAPQSFAAAPSSLLHPGGSVTVSTLHAAVRSSTAAAQPPTHPHRQRSQTAAQTSTSSPRAFAASTLDTPTTVEQLHDFGGVSVAEQVKDFGASEQGVTPPDTQLATGPTAVVETTNSSMLVMGRYGENRHLVDLYSFWGANVPNGYGITDSRIVYDALAQRWYLSSLFFGPANQVSVIGLAASTGTDPSGSWRTWTFTSVAHTLDDQPLLGFDDNVIVLSWNAFDNNNSNLCGTPNYAQFLVVDKHDANDALVMTPATHLSAQLAGDQSLVPSISQTSTGTEYMVFNKEDLNCNDQTTYLEWSKVGVLPVTGEPDAGGTDTTAVGTETDMTLRDGQGNPYTTSAPPYARQVNGNYLDDSDGRMQSVVFTGGTLYTAGAAAFMPSGSFFLSALLVEQIDTGTWAMSNPVLYSQNQDLFDPAVAVDSNGVAFYSFTRSGFQQYASSGAFAFDWNGTGNLYSAGILRSGTGAGDYACGDPGCMLLSTANGDPYNVERWGDYLGIAVDPVNGNDVWVASEFAPSNGNNWSTAIARVSIARPTISGISVSSGRTGGGTATTITGSEFDPASVRAEIGGTSAESLTWLDPDHLAVVTPPHPAGGVAVSVTTADGTSNAAGFTYVLPPVRTGYWLVASDGGIFSFGDAGFHGSTGAMRLNQPIVGMAATPTGNGYWLVASDGGIFSFGDAAFHGSTGNIRLNNPIVGMAATPDGGGYWLVASDGGIFSFGDAAFHGSTGNIRLVQPIVGMAATPTGNGYWLVASDGGIFSFGDAVFHGSTGNIRLNQPIRGMAATSDGGGYWLVARDGGIFTFGDAVFHGSAGDIALVQPIVGMASSGDDGGYWLVAADGGIFSYGDAVFHGSTGNIRLVQPIVGMASVPA